MPENYGPHLLGRVPSPPDDRDLDVEDYLRAAASPDPLNQELALLLKSRAAVATKNWALAATPRIIEASPVPPDPTPVPDPPSPSPSPSPTGDVEWADTDAVLDQGETPHCVGFGWAQYGNTQPVDDHYVNDDGHKIYYEAKVIDGEPKAEDGSNVRSGAAAMKDRKRVAAYAFARTIAIAALWVKTHGTVVLGTDWTQDMFYPDADGIIHPTGGVVGGHCYAWIGVVTINGQEYAVILNSWNETWGKNGRAYILLTELEELFASNGEACTALELAA